MAPVGNNPVHFQEREGKYIVNIVLFVHVMEQTEEQHWTSPDFCISKAPCYVQEAGHNSTKSHLYKGQEQGKLLKVTNSKRVIPFDGGY